MSRTATRLIAALVLAGASLIPSLASAQVSVQLYWGPNNQAYYFDRYHHRHYLTYQEARAWALREDPRWYHAHEREWHNNPRLFAQAWHRRHNEHYHNGY